jgi:asparagine synthase (glutamine-hydrolysing)
MSGIIYGYFSLNEQPVEQETIETLRKANSFWGPDGDELWSNEHACLGSLIMLNTPEAIYEKQPLIFDEGRKIMVANARIDNRDDLCREFEIPLSARDIFPDSFYMKLAYEKWGEACADHLIGDWSMAVYDIVTRHLFVARDHHGIMACYYYQGPDFFVFSSSLKGILALPQVPKKENEYKIAQFLVKVNDGGPETCYLGINRLLPAHVMTLKEGILNTRQFWFLEKQPKIRFKTEQEYVEKFRELYTEAVRCRLRSFRPVGATLSSGLDSGSVCILASQELAKYGKRLQAYTAVPLYDVPAPKGRIGNEGPYAQELAAKLGNVDVTLCNAANVSPQEGIDKMYEIHDQPDISANNAYWLIDIFNHVKVDNLGTILTGQGGNATVSWPPSGIYLWEKHVFRSFARYLFNWVYYKTNLWEKKYQVSPEILKNKKIRSLIKKRAIYFYHPFNFRKRRIEILRIGMDSASRRWYENGLFYITEFRDPTLDIRLISLLFKNNFEESLNPQRKIFIKIFHLYFNPFILYSKIRGKQSYDIEKRLLKIDL